MARDRAKPCELDQEKYDADDNVKIICLGDSAVGKSKYVGRLGEQSQAQNRSGVLEKPSRGTEEHGFCGCGEGAQVWGNKGASHQQLCVSGEEGQRGLSQG